MNIQTLINNNKDKITEFRKSAEMLAPTFSAFVVCTFSICTFLYNLCQRQLIPASIIHLDAQPALGAYLTTELLSTLVYLVFIFPLSVIILTYIRHKK